MLLLVYVCPPAAVLLMGRPVSAILNLLLTGLFLWAPGVKHALAIYADWRVSKHCDRIVDAINHPAYMRCGCCRCR